LLVSSSRREDPSRSNHSICSASSSQPRATSSNALFMDGLLVCAARFLASAALCRYSSDRDDMQGEHWKDASVPQIHRTFRQVRRWSVSHLCLPTNPVQMTSPGPSRARGGSGRSLTGATERPMAFKWTKASRAKLSRSQKARWKERKRQQRRKRAKRSSL